MKFLSTLVFLLLSAFISKAVAKKAVCFKPYVKGDCRSLSELWVYDSTSEKCIKHHGCYREKRGHSRTEEECLNKCA